MRPKSPFKSPYLIAAFALVLLLCAQPSSAVANPLAEGRAEFALSAGFLKQLRRGGVAIRPNSAARTGVLGRSVSGGALDPTNGVGTIELAGGIALDHGKRSAGVRAVVVDTQNGVIRGDLAGKRMKLAFLSGVSSSRSGFGVDVSIARMELTGKAARRLNNVLELEGQVRLQGGRALGSMRSTTQPSSVELVPGGLIRVYAETSTSSAIYKLFSKDAFFQAIKPASVHYSGLMPGQFPQAVSFFLLLKEGSIAPDGSSGLLETGGGFTIEKPAHTPNPILRVENIAIGLGGGAFSADLSRSPTPLSGPAIPTIATFDTAHAVVKSDPAHRTIQYEVPMVAVTGAFASLLNETFNQPPPSPPASSDLVAGDQLGVLSFTLTAR